MIQNLVLNTIIVDGMATRYAPALPPGGTMANQRLLAVYRAMRLARYVDEAEMDLIRRGDAFFHVSCRGHEGTAILDPFLKGDDWLHLHYRDKALMLARGVPPEAFLQSLLCSGSSHSAGRQMSAHMSAPALRILSIVGPVGNNALQAVGIAAEEKRAGRRTIVVCAFGDGTSQQGEVLEAMAEAARWRPPVLFFVEDNRLAISTSTAGRTFYGLSAGQPDAHCLGLAVHHLDGRHVAQCGGELGPIVARVRESQEPAVVVFHVERLSDHTNADDERVYRGPEERAQIAAAADPVENLRKHLLAAGVREDWLQEIEAEAGAQVAAALQRALEDSMPVAATDAKAELPAHLRTEVEPDAGAADEPRLTMREAIRKVLRDRLAADRRITLFGEDIEDPKGDVFGVTGGLSTAFPGRVVNSPLSEATIVGTSIGRALAGGRPVGLIQFADFLPLAFNQILSEMGSMHWRTNGGWQCPVILMAPSGAYRPGLGPFHAQTLESVLAHVPGIDVFMPSCAADAAGLLNAAFESGRPTVFLYPKTCLNDREGAVAGDVHRRLAVPGKARIVAEGDALTIVAWGSTVPLCRKAVAALETTGQRAELIDLRSISPWDREAVVASARKTGCLLVVHEDNVTCGFGAEIVAAVSEALPGLRAIRRVARPDTYVPCNFANQLEILPSLRRIVTAAADLLEMDVERRLPAEGSESLLSIEALGSSPADQTVTVLKWNVSRGQVVQSNQALAELEADKAVFELTSPAAGVVKDILVPEGESVPVHTSLLELLPRDITTRRKPATCEEPGEPLFRRRQLLAAASRRPAARAITVGISTVYPVIGSVRRDNAELLGDLPGKTVDDIVRRTGIHSRRWAAPNETPLSMAVEACRRALAGEGLALEQIDAIICSTTTPMAVTPSLACRIHHGLRAGSPARSIPCYDMLAACSGYLYALSAAYDFVHARQDAVVLVVTADVLSRAVDRHDFDTAILFGDAASATLIYGSGHAQRMKAVLHRPVISARGEEGELLAVPLGGAGPVRMDGRKVFAEAVRGMVDILGQACGEAGIRADELDLVVPHQANGRIIEAIRRRMDLPPERVVNCLQDLGNTSSSSIPVALGGLGSALHHRRIGLCAFGGGLTFAAAVLSTGEIGQ